MPYLIKSGYCTIDGVGRVYVSVRSASKSVRAQWKAGEIYVSAPMNMDYDRLVEILKDFVPKLNKVKPDAPYYIGQQWDFGEFKADISMQTHMPDYILANLRDDNCYHITVGSNVDITSKNAIKVISKYLCRMAQSMAYKVLIPRGKEIAAELGVSPKGWDISSGHRTLGTCSSKKEIRLSYALIFYPYHLRDYVICHELAHLSEMNHSPRFHEICNRYCGGNEKQLEAQLRTIKLPIVI